MHGFLIPDTEEPVSRVVLQNFEEEIGDVLLLLLDCLCVALLFLAHFVHALLLFVKILYNLIQVFHYVADGWRENAFWTRIFVGRLPRMFIEFLIEI